MRLSFPKIISTTIDPVLRVTSMRSLEEINAVFVPMYRSLGKVP